jgi:hypothetical protein
MPLKVPRMSRMVYDSRQGLSITFDLAVSKAATKLGGRGTFTFYLYRSDPAWGFRAATKKYYTIQPEAFVRRTDPAREGGWFIKPILEELDSPDTAADESKPFGLGLNMVSLGTDSTGRHRDWGTGLSPGITPARSTRPRTTTTGASSSRDVRLASLGVRCSPTGKRWPSCGRTPRSPREMMSKRDSRRNHRAR